MCASACPYLFESPLTQICSSQASASCCLRTQIQRLQGADMSVCMHREDFDEGERVQEMPCNSAHAFHAACLAPWLAKENSCPICRHELPTDDGRYERDKAEAVKAKGAANAVSHKEFIYL